jgi:hypothetical protein
VLHCASVNPADILAGMAGRKTFSPGGKSKGVEMMFRMRKYTEILVSSSVYVNSQGDYTFSVRIKGYGHVKYDPSVGFWTETAEPKFPKYVEEAVDEQVVQLLMGNDTVYYEYDRDGNKRYENFRYHDPENAKGYGRQILASLEKKS